MRPDSRASRTAQRVAMRRAMHQVIDGEPKVLHDPIAVAIVGRENLETEDSLGSRTMRAFMVARSRYAEDKLAAAVRNGVRQYVVLGAGLDTFAYRNPFPDVRVFEVDHPATQAWKRDRLRAAGIELPKQFAFVAVDFEKQALDTELAAAGFTQAEPAFFSWLGVTPYLTRPAFEGTARFIASMPAGSGVAFDFAVDRSALGFLERAALDELSRRVASAGEPFQLFFDPQALENELRSMGFSEVERLNADEINARYFANRSDRLRVRGGLGQLIGAYIF
ncbi:MAG TPA: class I SAM-dependent methyltransferase [Bryobacteraceae bacterium]